MVKNKDFHKFLLAQKDRKILRKSRKETFSSKCATLENVIINVDF